MREEITYRVITTTDPMFSNRGVTMFSGESMDSMKLQSYSPIPDSVVLCNGCNTNLYPGECDAVYIDGRLRDVYCRGCREKYFPQAVERR